MKPEDLKAAAIQLHGPYGWQTLLAASLRVNVSTVRRWCAGQVPIPGPVEAAVACFLKEKGK